MVTIKRLSLVLLLSLAVLPAPDAAAQQQKIAYVASEAILEKLPDAVSARAKLSELQAGWMREIQRQEQEVTKLGTEIQTNRLLWSTQEKRDAEARLADMQAKLGTYRSVKFGPNQEFDRQQTDLMGPVIDKIWKAIDDEARAQKYDFVFDKSSRGVGMVYANPTHDLTWAVLKRLGVDVQPPAAAEETSGATDTAREQDARRNRGRGRQQTPPPADQSFDPNRALEINGGTVPPPGDGGSDEPVESPK